MDCQPVSDLDAARPEWTALAERSGNVFSTWEWASCWMRRMGAGEELRAQVCRRPDGQAAAILPLCRSRRGPLHVMRLVGHGESDELGPVCAPADRAAADAQLTSVLAGDASCDVFVGHDMAQRPPGAAVLGRMASPAVRLEGGGWDEFLAGRSRNFRQQVRARERALARAGRLEFRLADDPVRLDADMSTLIGLHRRRWGARSRSFAGPREALHREFAALALERGWLRLRLLELDGRPLAALYAFRYGGDEWYYQLGRDSAFDRFAVGFVLIAHAIRRALEDGLGQFRLLRGDEGYKARFATHDSGVVTVGMARTTAGRALLQGERMWRALPSGARRRLRRLGGQR
jgi:CelD/BcsL family acetyltransferase involved in cellulose biosynthesis